MVKLVQTIWLQLVHMIKDQYDAIVGTSDAIFLKRSPFCRTGNTGLFSFYVKVNHVGPLNACIVISTLAMVLVSQQIDISTLYLVFPCNFFNYLEGLLYEKKNIMLSLRIMSN